MIKGLCITPPILGRISIGKVIERNGKRLPEKSDEFSITTQVQNREGWLAHPYDDEFRKSSANGKLRSIPIRVLFSDPELCLRAEYHMFDRNTGRPLCVGNGDTCKRYTPNGIEALPCPSPDGCEFSKGGLCKPYGRLNIKIGDDDDLGSFVFRTTGFNSIRSLAARLHYYRAVSGNLLACLPLELRIRGKSTTMSHRAAIYYVDITIREGLTLEDALTEAKQNDARRKTVGYNQAALDVAAHKGFSNGAFEDSVDEVFEVIDEFFHAGGNSNIHEEIQSNAATDNPKPGPTLLTRLDGKLNSGTPKSATDLTIPRE
jgi:hypothetical protein